MSQVKRLGRVIDSVYKKRLIMLNEYLQYLKTQSSSKNVIRKLKSLDQNPKVIFIYSILKYIRVIK